MSALFSIIIPARDEEHLQRTIQCALDNIEGDTEIIAICDGYWPEPPVPDNPRVHIIHHTVSVGQRAATNEGARLSTAKYIMKADAHCTFDKGFDVKLMQPYESGEIGMDTTTIPRLYNLHGFNLKCLGCGYERYQSPTTNPCPECKQTVGVERVMIWKPRWHKRVDFCRIDSSMRFQYWRAFESRDAAKGDICDVMGNLGACFMMPRERFLALGGMDEKHGSWGQFGTEISCKSWLSGGRQVVNKRTWYSHLFRTQGGDFGFPYQLSQNQIERARDYSVWLWKEGNWPLAARPLRWLIDHFAPVPDWDGNP